MLSGRNRAKCRPRAQGGTLRRRIGARTSPKGAGQHSEATNRGENVAQGCHPALTGDRKGHKRRPRVSPSTHRQRKGARMSPKGAGRHSEATNMSENVAQGRRAALLGNEYEGICHQWVQSEPLGTYFFEYILSSSDCEKRLNLACQ